MRNPRLDLPLTLMVGDELRITFTRPTTITALETTPDGSIPYSRLEAHTIDSLRAQLVSLTADNARLRARLMAYLEDE